MLNYREFEAGPDPFGRKFQVLFKWLMTAISIRHSDSVDVKFVLVDDGGGRTEKTIVLPHADLVRFSRDLGRPLDDPWCARIAQLHLLHLIATGEDMEKDLVTVPAGHIKRYAEELFRTEAAEVGVR